MKRHEMWRADYRANRYMADADNADLEQRSRDIQINMMKVDPLGRLIPADVLATPWWEMWTQVLEEGALRGWGPFSPRLMARDPLPVLGYDDVPLGTRILGERSLPTAPYLARIGQRQHIIEAFTKGRFRIAPASYYSDPSLNLAIRDDELSLAMTHSSRGATARGIDPETGIEGEEIPLIGEIKMHRTLSDNFYVLCFSHSYDCRLLDDFSGDAIIFITDPVQFAKRLANAVGKIRPDLDCVFRDVRYYDPYFVTKRPGDIAFLKHFRYAYQNEARFVWARPSLGRVLEPIVVEIGSLRDIAKLRAFPV